MNYSQQAKYRSSGAPARTAVMPAAGALIAIAPLVASAPAMASTNNETSSTTRQSHQPAPADTAHARDELHFAMKAGPTVEAKLYWGELKLGTAG